MEIDQPTIQQKAGHFTCAWSCFKALPGEAKAKAIKVAKSSKKLGEDDPRRVIHSLKVGLALTFVSFFYYSRPLYDGFGQSGMWAVLTVVVIFEFTVGGTLSKGLYRGLATLLACALGFGASNLASLFGRKGQPIVIGILVFLLVAASTFTRFFPRIKARYDYGVVIFILTFSLVSVSGYRVEKLLVLAHQRLSTILIGGAICMLLSFIFPVWAGEDLHKLVASNVEKLAKYLEGFGGEFFQPLEDERNVKVSNADKSFLRRYKNVLNSKSTEESMAPLKFRCKIQGPCTRMSIECSMALESLALAIKTMTLPSSANVHVENSKTAIKDLKIAIKTVSLDHDQDLLAIVPAATVATIIIEIVKCVEILSESVHELSDLAHFKSVEPTVSLEKPPFLHRGSIKPVLEGDADRVIIAIDVKSADSPESENTQGPMPGQRLEV
ncbi:hypothetical protein D5086_029197 [Populus alba]|uniref:Uncharacterized protein n=1 Tax=Populus alba TaxID=43335 RepID=A0ACC4ASS9_POPAL